jgi:signal transduction histidine kinase
MIFQLKNIDEQIKNLKIIHAQNSRLQNFAHIISHNLRSHGGNINTLAEMAMVESTSVDKNQVLAMLKCTSGRLLETLENLNEIVKEQQQYPIYTTSIMIEEEINRVLEILAASIRQADAAIELDIPSQEQISFNPAYFESIIINLITNAIKYKHPERKPVIQINVRSYRDHIQLSVSDNGIGIDLATHKGSIFGLYETFHNHPDSRGVGLYLVKQQIEELGGGITVKSKLSHGTQFLLSFPK